MDASDETQRPGHFAAREIGLVFIELGAGGSWSCSGCCGEKIALLLLQDLNRISSSVYRSQLPQTDLKIIQNSVLIK